MEVFNAALSSLQECCGGRQKLSESSHATPQAQVLAAPHGGVDNTPALEAALPTGKTGQQSALSTTLEAFLAGHTGSHPDVPGPATYPKIQHHPAPLIPLAPWQSDGESWTGSRLPPEIRVKILEYVALENGRDLRAVSQVNKNVYAILAGEADKARKARKTGSTHIDGLGERYLQAQEAAREAESVAKKHRGQGGVLYRQTGDSFPQTISQEAFAWRSPGFAALKELGPHLPHLPRKEEVHLKDLAAAIAEHALTKIGEPVGNLTTAIVHQTAVRAVTVLLRFEYFPIDTVDEFLTQAAGPVATRKFVQKEFAYMWEHLRPPNRQAELLTAQDKLLTAIEGSPADDPSRTLLDLRPLVSSREILLHVLARKLVDMSAAHQVRWTAMVRGSSVHAVARDFVMATANRALVLSAKLWNGLTRQQIDALTDEDENDLIQQQQFVLTPPERVGEAFPQERDPLTPQQRDCLLTAIEYIGADASFEIHMTLAHKLVDMNAEQQMRWAEVVALLPGPSDEVLAPVDVRTPVIAAADAALAESARQWKDLTLQRRYGLLRAIANTPVRKFELLMALAPEAGGMSDDQQAQWASTAAEFTGHQRQQLIDATQKSLGRQALSKL
jgi:hypothetical protein